MIPLLHRGMYLLCTDSVRFGNGLISCRIGVNIRKFVKNQSLSCSLAIHMLFFCFSKQFFPIISQGEGPSYVTGPNSFRQIRVSDSSIDAQVVFIGQLDEHFSRGRMYETPSIEGNAAEI